jgi:predicted AAA+ superfamily ATPase
VKTGLFPVLRVLADRPNQPATFLILGSASPNLRKGIEIKFQDAPKLSRSMRIAMEDLKLKELLVVYPGNKEYPLAEGIRAVPLANVSRA